VAKDTNFHYLQPQFLYAVNTSPYLTVGKLKLKKAKDCMQEKRIIVPQIWSLEKLSLNFEIT
jgi:hypothetical protein